MVEEQECKKMGGRFIDGLCMVESEGKITEVQLKELRGSHGGLLEPAPEYGDSILFDPYTHGYVMVTVPKNNPRVTPRFTEVDRESLKIAKTYVKRAADAVRKEATTSSLEKAFRELESATYIEPWKHYPTAGLEKNPIYQEIRYGANWVGTRLASAAQTTNPSMKKQFLDEGRQKILSMEESLIGTH